MRGAQQRRPRRRGRHRARAQSCTHGRPLDVRLWIGRRPGERHARRRARARPAQRECGRGAVRRAADVTAWRPEAADLARRRRTLVRPLARAAHVPRQRQRTHAALGRAIVYRRGLRRLRDTASGEPAPARERAAAVPPRRHAVTRARQPDAPASRRGRRCAVGDHRRGRWCDARARTRFGRHRHLPAARRAHAHGHAPPLPRSGGCGR